MKKGISIIIFAIVIGVWFWNSSSETWTGFYYPEEGNTFSYIKSPEFRKLEECQSWVNVQVNNYNPDGYGYDYECGKNCKLSDSGVDIYHCKETAE